jgi:hypothetical protein
MWHLVPAVLDTHGFCRVSVPTGARVDALYCDRLELKDMRLAQLPGLTLDKLRDVVELIDTVACLKFCLFCRVAEKRIVARGHYLPLVAGLLIDGALRHLAGHVTVLDLRVAEGPVCPLIAGRMRRQRACVLKPSYFLKQLFVSLVHFVASG